MKLILLCMAVVLLASGVELVLLKFHKTYSVDERFTAANITPQVYPRSPDSALQLYFGDLEVALGSEISPADAIEQPMIAYDFENGFNYTLLMLGPDEPSPDCAFLSLYLMGLYVNMYGSADGMITEESCEIASYIPPNPPPGFGTHRIIFYIFKQAGIINTSDHELLDLQINRFGFPLEDFVASYGLFGPISGTFYFTKYPLCSTQRDQ